jgi:ABC-type multidrug transport system ATPase subunit
MLVLRKGFTIGYQRKELARCDTELVVDPCLSGSNITVVCGPNGSGKTTLFRTLAAIIPAIRSEAAIAGLSIHLARQYGLISYLPDTIDFDGSMPCGLILRTLCGDFSDVQRCAGALHLNLPDLFARVSKGQQQKLRVILALQRAAGDGLCLMDEPFSGLDIESREVAMELMAARFRGDRKRLLISLHTERLPHGWCQNALLFQSKGAISLVHGTDDIYELRRTGTSCNPRPAS